MSDAPMTEIRIDHKVIAELVELNSRVLDVGCGDGELLQLLATQKGADARGIEISQIGVNFCVARGLSVIQGDANEDLAAYPDGAFDYVVLSQTLQATWDPKEVMTRLLRIGEHVIVSIPNFGYWQNRLHLMFKGRMPVTDYLPHSWYNTPNIHFCTLRDFVDLTKEVGCTVDKAVVLNGIGQRIPIQAPWWLWNLFGEQAVFLLKE
ncbi:methionine biosynthesis protein MetW [Breoghania sp.]|uniref:methionine biosynthesis protein MetW n=1 Tax=Breoghania sp. TaxID=2065378 RepID=UPI0026283D4B|nr:methionine biosynthesis protein MetW [Breoghania sp.]MDJ0931438.1 methionine biosynthesis protein MetW [Breoghania sp.]